MKRKSCKSFYYFWRRWSRPGLQPLQQRRMPLSRPRRRLLPPTTPTPGRSLPPPPQPRRTHATMSENFKGEMETYEKSAVESNCKDKIKGRRACMEKIGRVAKKSSRLIRSWPQVCSITKCVAAWTEGPGPGEMIYYRIVGLPSCHYVLRAYPSDIRVWVAKPLCDWWLRAKNST